MQFIVQYLLRGSGRHVIEFGMCTRCSSSISSTLSNGTSNNCFGIEDSAVGRLSGPITVAKVGYSPLHSFMNTYMIMQFGRNGTVIDLYIATGNLMRCMDRATPFGLYV